VVAIVLMGDTEAAAHNKDGLAPDTMGLDFLQHEDWSASTVSRISGSLIGADSITRAADQGQTDELKSTPAVQRIPAPTQKESAGEQEEESQVQAAKDFMKNFGAEDGGQKLNKFYTDSEDDEKDEEKKAYEKTFTHESDEEKYAHEISLVPDQKEDEEMAELKRETTDPNWRKEDAVKKQAKQQAKQQQTATQPTVQVAVAKPVQKVKPVRKVKLVSPPVQPPKVVAATVAPKSADAVVPEETPQKESPLAMLTKAVHHTSAAIVTAQHVKSISKAQAPPKAQPTPDAASSTAVQEVVNTVVAPKLSLTPDPKPATAQLAASTVPDTLTIHAAPLPVAKKPLSAAVLKKRQQIIDEMKHPKKHPSQKKEPHLSKNAFKDLESMTNGITESKDNIDEDTDEDTDEDSDSGSDSDSYDPQTMSQSAFEAMVDNPDKVQDAGDDDDTQDGSSIRDFLQNERAALKKEGKKPPSTKAVIEREEQIRTAPVEVVELPENANEETTQTEQDMGMTKPVTPSAQRAKPKGGVQMHDPLAAMAKATEAKSTQTTAAAKAQSDNVVSDMISKLGGSDDEDDDYD